MTRICATAYEVSCCKRHYSNQIDALAFVSTILPWLVIVFSAVPLIYTLLSVQRCASLSCYKAYSREHSSSSVLMSRASYMTTYHNDTAFNTALIVLYDRPGSNEDRKKLSPDFAYGGCLGY